MTTQRRAVLVGDAAALAILKLAVGAWVLHQGFTHVSDDDYARVVISEQFAHAPRIDPSGTSWLPLPFWVEGLAMLAAGRSLAAARGVALLLGCASVAAPYLGMRAAGAARLPSLAATAVGLATPWNAWLGVATVPDGWVGALVAGSAVALARGSARGWAVIGLLTASLCRYEAWAAAAMGAAFCAAAWWRRGSRKELGLAAVALLAPCAWMAWNAHAHGSPTHFLARVAAFRHAIGAADLSLSAKLLGYPTALLHDCPDALVLGAVGLSGFSDRAFRSRWTAPALTGAAMFAFLVWGDVQDGAPTHHPARALASIAWIAVGMGVDSLHSWDTRQRLGGAPKLAWRVGAATLALAWSATLPGRWALAPGEGPSERRDTQIARGTALRAAAVEHAVIRPCAYEHFAVVAAWGAPERARLLPSRHEPVTDGCPEITADR